MLAFPLQSLQTLFLYKPKMALPGFAAAKQTPNFHQTIKTLPPKELA